MPCHLVRHFHVRQFHARHIGPSILCPAISCPAILMVRHFHVQHFQSTLSFLCIRLKYRNYLFGSFCLTLSSHINNVNAVVGLIFHQCSFSSFSSFNIFTNFSSVPCARLIWQFSVRLSVVKRYVK